MRQVYFVVTMGEGSKIFALSFWRRVPGGIGTEK